MTLTENEQTKKRRRGGQPGNRNAAGHGAPRGNRNAVGHGPRLGNKNALKHGLYERIAYIDEEQGLAYVDRGPLGIIVYRRIGPPGSERYCLLGRWLGGKKV